MRVTSRSIAELIGALMLAGLVLNPTGQLKARSETAVLIHSAPAAFWSFQPLRPSQPPALPSKRPAAWPRNPIDSFVLAKLQQNHLLPAPAASRLALVRRAYFDLLGLPPKP